MPTEPPAETTTSKPSIATAVLTFLKRYSFESLLSLGLLTLVSPALDRAKEALLGQSEGPSFYIDQIACPQATGGDAAAPAESGDCHLLNLRIPGGQEERTLNRIDISSLASPDITIRLSGQPANLEVDKELLRTYRAASVTLDSRIAPGKLLIVTALGRFGPDTAVSVVLDGSGRPARQLAIASGRVLFLTEYWGQILLVAVAALFTVRYRQLVIEKLAKA